MKAMTTKYHPAGNSKGARISADDGDGNRVYVPYPYELSGSDVHFKAVAALCAKMKWGGVLIPGDVKDGMVWVWADTDKKYTIPVVCE